MDFEDLHKNFLKYLNDFLYQSMFNDILDILNKYIKIYFTCYLFLFF